MTDINEKKIFQKNLTDLISLSGQTQKEIADAIGVLPQTLNTWVQGIAIPRMGKIQLLADYFHVAKSDLIEERTASPSEESAKESQSGKKYYFSDETAEMAQRLFEDQDLRMLFDASRDSRPEDLKMAADMLKRFKGTNPDE